MKSLFLDDRIDRCQRFREWWPSVTCVHTAADAIAEIERECYGIIFLDHDLGGRIGQSSHEANTGMEVVRHLVARPPLVLPKIVIHSGNFLAAVEMEESLKKAGYEVLQASFGSFPKTLNAISRWSRAQQHLMKGRA